MNYGTILVVDDDALSRALCTDILTNAGHKVTTAASGHEALGALKEENFDVVVTDLVMPGMDGIEVLEGVKQYNALIDVVVITGHSSIESAITALKKGAFEYIRKPLHADELLLTVQSSLEKKALLEENEEMRRSLRLFKVGRTITSSLDLEKLYKVSLDSMIQTLPAEAGLMLYSDEETEVLKIKAARGLDPSAGEYLLSLFTDSAEHTLHGTKEVTVLSTDGLKSAHGESLAGFASMTVIPLSVRSGSTETFFGYIVTLSSKPESEYADETVKVAEFVADHACQAFTNARKYGEAQEMAYIDSLTNLYNAKYLELSLERELKRADRQKIPLTVLFLDVDHFKNVNDQNDHIAGSKVLVEVGGILKSAIREVDTAIRYGGDEYVVILVDADCESGFQVAERIRASVEEQTFLHSEGLDLKITVSIGVATYPVHTTEKSELLRIADSAMYTAKKSARNMVFLYPVPGADSESG
ncbi:MAG: diguanylate cyclase [Proteobacteria bacterium]|nr:diguanylate cyclase [Pseudomonadota bacterium]